jgi:hypothetical protein
MDPITGPLLAIVAAIIAGLFSYFNIVLSKEQKLSEFRQNWIDGLRDDVSEFMAALDSLAYTVETYRHQQSGKLDLVSLASASQEAHIKASVKFNHIILRLDPGEKGLFQQQLAGLLEEIRQAFQAEDFKKTRAFFPDLREKTRAVLKAEWERVKVGEPTYRWSKRSVLAVLMVALPLGTFFVFKNVKWSASRGTATVDSKSAAGEVRKQ